MYDVIVVGARCAGAPLAMLLARAGHKVALADRASFPSDTMSTHFLWQRGAARLNAWGLLGAAAGTRLRADPPDHLRHRAGAARPASARPSAVSRKRTARGGPYWTRCS